MKVILTEAQYELIENIIKEVAESFTNDIEKGGSIELITKDGINRYDVINVFGSGQYVEVSDKYGSYIFDLSKSLNKNNNSFTALKNGRYQGAQVNLKGKIMSPQGITGGSPITVNNVFRIDIFDRNGDIVDTAYTEIGDVARRSGDDKEDEVKKNIEREKEIEREKKMREKRVYDMMINNPDFIKAFRHQPKLFKGLLNYGRVKGIGPAKNRIEKYIQQYKGKQKEKENKKEKDDFKEFKVNSNIRFEIINKPITLSYGDQKLRLNVGDTYAARYVGKQYLKGKGFKIYLNQKEIDNIYSGTLKAFFKEEGVEGGVDKIVDKMDNVIIKIKDYNF